MALVSQDFLIYLQFLQSSTIDYLSQIVEEGVIFAYEDAL